MPEQAVETPPEAVPAPEPPRPRPGLNKLLVVAGVVVSLIATACSAVLELFLTPLRVGGVLTGVSVVAAVVVNWALCWFALTTTGRRWSVAPPWALWTLIMFLAVGTGRPEGDRLVAGNDWIALVTVLAGSLSFAVYTYRLILKGPTVTKS
ncbi:hypothetical protein [Symbioplanes lichenis]|uniref:hypothetical protein n=1 Tax=Symbioplanes lichenis TaxID=1629072 RepID=UPI002738FDE1|nr:hypothetical protein [Actinoplanes lichenis]